MVKYIITLLPGSGICSAFVGIIGALHYLKSNAIDEAPYVNTFYAATPVKYMIDVFLNKEQINTVTFVQYNTIPYKSTYTDGDAYKELFFTPLTKSIYSELKNDSIPFAYFTEIFNSVYKLKGNITASCALLDVYSICVNIRRGDKVTLESHLPVASVSQYIDEINKIQTHTLSIHHTSDEYDTFLEMRRLLPTYSIHTLNSKDEKGYFISKLNKMLLTDKYIIDHVTKFLTQLHIMVHSEYFIGTLSTNVGYVVQLLRGVRRDPKNIYI